VDEEKDMEPAGLMNQAPTKTNRKFLLGCKLPAVSSNLLLLYALRLTKGWGLKFGFGIFYSSLVGICV